MPYAGINETERARDQELQIMTTEIEEWDESMLDYHRSEPTPYMALDRFIEHYMPFDNAYLIDYGCGLGRINLYFHHYLHLPGLGLEVDPVRAQRARKNINAYAAGQHINTEQLDIEIIETKAEEFLPPAKANTFFFFNPFSDWIFRQALEQIIASIQAHDRTIDIILYYPSLGYFHSLETSGYFEEWLFVDCPWNKDPRDGFWVYRHWGSEG